MTIPSSGIYGLFRLDGGSVAPADAAILALVGADERRSAVADGVDRQAPDAIHRSDADGRITLLAGYLDEPEEMADRLGLSRVLPHACLARAALLRFGADTPGMLIGEWTLLDWEPEGRLTLMASAARRDRLFFAVRGADCAVAPDLARLARLDWIDDSIDPVGLLHGVGRKSLRERGARRSLLKQVEQLGPGDCVTITRDGVKRETATVLTPQPRFRGSFEDAVAETESLLRRIMRQRVRRTGMPVGLLSGGLDSSLLAWLTAAERTPGQAIGFLTLVAPPGSGIPDEAPFANMVGESIGVVVDPVWAPADADAYRPADLSIVGAAGPILTNRHCQTEEIQRAMSARGATMLVNGTYGEMSVTGRSRIPTLGQRMRGVAGRMLRRGARFEDDRGFHVRIAPALLAHLPEEIRAAMAAPPVAIETRVNDGLWGYLPGVQSALWQSNEFCPGALRMDFPFRDLRLLRLFAGMPAAFLTRDGDDRAPARRILDGRLPDAIRLRRSGMPAVADHITRLQRQAAPTRERIPVFRRAGLDAWFDLDWLDGALARVAAEGPAHVGDANEVQLTAINAEMLLWWMTRRSS